MMQTLALPYDRFKMDQKSSMKYYFQTLECYAVPRVYADKKQILWFEPDSEISIPRIITAEHATFFINSFYLDKCDIDFSQPNIAGDIRPREKTQFDFEPQNKSCLWDNEERKQSLDLNVSTVRGEMASQEYQDFMKSLELISNVRPSIFVFRKRSESHQSVGVGVGVGVLVSVYLWVYWWLCICECLWVSVGVPVYLWVSVGVCGCLWVRVWGVILPSQIFSVALAAAHF